MKTSIIYLCLAHQQGRQNLTIDGKVWSNNSVEQYEKGKLPFEIVQAKNNGILTVTNQKKYDEGTRPVALKSEVVEKDVSAKEVSEKQATSSEKNTSSSRGRKPKETDTTDNNANK